MEAAVAATLDREAATLETTGRGQIPGIETADESQPKMIHR